MPTITYETYEVDVKMIIIKKYWDKDCGKMTINKIKDKIQQGIEVPIEEVSVKIKDD
jgi:hypothetical protein